MQRQPARRGESLRAFVSQVAVDQRVGDEPLQILRRLPLHAGGDFFAEQFEEKVGHIEELFDFDGESGEPSPRPSPRRERAAIPSPPGRRWRAKPAG